ncbi:MAG: hydroxyacid dehydrogenase [Candidatus Micrarchaeota archaeon]|nr:hydroxyacid dehydrogenase [Candidatus Micrarchaeota archaeon]
MKIVIADHLEQEVISGLKQLGECIVTPPDLSSALKEADVLIVRSATKVTESLLELAPKLKIVARAGVGTDNIDLHACQKRNIKVVNTPNASTNAVAEFTLALILCFCRKIHLADSSMKNKKWIKKELMGTELEGKTIGIVGFGRIGSLVALKAKSLGMNVLIYDTKATSSSLGKTATLEELFAQSDFVSLHLPATAQTYKLVNARLLSLMKKTAVLINTARGSIIDEEALYDVLSKNMIGGACLDVYENEPYQGKLCELPNVILTPHIAGSSAEAQRKIGQELIQILKEEFSR